MNNDYCDCLGADVGIEGPSFFRTTDVLCGRKEHRCSGCRGAIPVGQPSVTAVGAWDGELNTFRYHRTCFDIMRAAAAFYGTGYYMECDIKRCVEGWYNDARSQSGGEQLRLAIERYAYEGGSA